jgi:molybdate transport system ATP-binding protein
LLDEPLASLDQTRRNDFLPWLDRLHRELEMPVVYVTHSMHELVRLADHVVLLREGRVTASGTAADVLTDPAVLRDLGLHAGTITRGIVIERDPDQGLVRVELQDQAIWVRDDGLEIGSSIPLHVQLGFDARQPNRDPSTPPAKA